MIPKLKCMYVDDSIFRLNENISEKLEELKILSHSIKDYTKDIEIEQNAFLMQEDLLLVEDWIATCINKKSSVITNSLTHLVSMKLGLLLKFKNIILKKMIDQLLANALNQNTFCCQTSEVVFPNNDINLINKLFSNYPKDNELDKDVNKSIITNQPHVFSEFEFLNSNDFLRVMLNNKIFQECEDICVNYPINNDNKSIQKIDMKGNNQVNIKGKILLKYDN